MGKTRRWKPRDGEFKKLKASKQKRNKKRQVSKVELRKEVKFTNRNPDTGFVNCWDVEPNDETLAAMAEENLQEFDSVEELMKDLNENGNEN